MSQFGQKVVAVIDTTSSFGVTVQTLKQNVATLTGQMSTLLADAPETLDTLNEIAAAISDDPAFFTTMASANTTLQANITALSTAAADARTALQTALQANIDAEALAGTNARSVLGGRLDSLELDPVTKTYVDAAVTNLIDTAPGVLDTLNEIAAAIGDDANFITTVNSSIAAVQADVDANETASDAAEAALSGRLDTLEADPTTATALAAVQSDVDANEAASDAAETALSGRLDTLEADPTTATAVAAVQTDVDANQVTAANAVTAQNTAMLAAVAVVQADVDQNETDADAAINTEKARIDAILAGSAADKDTFAEIVTLINSVDTTNDNAFAGYVTSNNAAVAAVQADVDQNEADADAAIAGILDGADFTGNITSTGNITCSSGTLHAQYLTLANVNVNATATELNYVDGVTSNIQTQLNAIQSDVDANESDADTAIALKADTAGDTFTGDILLKNPSGNAVALRLSRTDNPDMNTEWKVQPSYVNIDKECLSIMAGSDVVASFDERQRLAVNTTDPDYTLDVGGDGNFSTNLTVGAAVNLTLTDAANDSAAATAGVAVNQLYRNGSVVMIRVS